MNTALSFFLWLNTRVLAFPATILFLGVGVYITFYTRCIQIRAIPRLMRLMRYGIPQKMIFGAASSNTISSFRALCTAMGTTIGMGNIVGPTIAIMTGGPGALAWLTIYMFFGSATKLSEVVFAIDTRIKTAGGHVVGGPMEYLRAVHPLLAQWYTLVMIVLFAGWSSVQANTLATIFAFEGIDPRCTGICLAIFVYLVVNGGARRIGALATMLVPFMFLLYLSCALMILLQDYQALFNACVLIKASTFSPAAPFGAFCGATLIQALKSGTYRAIYISESGLGVSSIAHSVAQVKYPIDQGILALFSAVADVTLSVISGLLVLVTGVWSTGVFRSTLIYEAFKIHAPLYGMFILLASILLFVVTTVIGNTFNGMQTFGSLTQYKYVQSYVAVTMIIIFCGSLMEVRLAWEVMDTLLTLVAIPNLVGLIVLIYKKGFLLELSQVDR